MTDSVGHEESALILSPSDAVAIVEAANRVARRLKPRKRGWLFMVGPELDAEWIRVGCDDGSVDFGVSCQDPECRGRQRNSGQGPGFLVEHVTAEERADQSFVPRCRECQQRAES